MSAITTHIDRLRHLDVDAARRPEIAQLTLIAQDIFGNVPLATTLERPEMAGFTAADVCAIAEDFGKFRARSNKGGPKAETLLVEETGFLPLPEFLPSRDELQRRSKRSPRHIRDWTQVVDPALLADNPAVIIPVGYEPTLLGRNIRGSLAALVITMPTEAEIERFWTRRYAENEAELTAEHVHLVWWLAVQGLGSKLDELDGSTGHLNGLLVRAHDVLEVARTDAFAAVEHLSEPDAHTADVTDLVTWTTQASWMHTGLFARVRKVLDALESGDSDRLRGILRTRLLSVRTWMSESSEAFTDIARLNDAHLRILVERAGLAYDAVEERKTRNEIRARLTALGMSADLDQELPAGVSAWRQGKLEEFYSSREARAAGDPDWQLLYVPATVEAVAAVAV